MESTSFFLIAELQNMFTAIFLFYLEWSGLNMLDSFKNDFSFYLKAGKLLFKLLVLFAFFFFIVYIHEHRNWLSKQASQRNQGRISFLASGDAAMKGS